MKRSHLTLFVEQSRSKINILRKHLFFTLKHSSYIIDILCIFCVLSLFMLENTALRNELSHSWWCSCSVMSKSCNPMDCSPPGSSVCGVLQARILEWVAISFSRVSIFPTQESNLSLQHCRRILYQPGYMGSPSHSYCHIIIVYQRPKGKYVLK